MTLTEKIESGKITGAYSVERKKSYLFENILDNRIVSDSEIIFTDRLCEGIIEGRWIPIHRGFYCKAFDSEGDDFGDIYEICDKCRTEKDGPYKKTGVDYFMTWEPLGCDGPRQCKECGDLIHTNDNQGSQL